MAGSRPPDKGNRLPGDLRSINRKLRDLQAADPLPWPEPDAAPEQAPPPSPPVGGAPSPSPDGLRGRLARVRAVAPGELPASAPRPQATGAGLEACIPGEVVPTPDGPVYVMRRRAAGDPGAAPGLAAGYLRGLGSPGGMALLDLAQDETIAPEDVAFFDLETTGLENVPLFLIGALGWEDGELVVHQLFARHYGEEKAAVALFLEHLRPRKVLVSFNGATFDVPFLRSRARVHRLSPQFGVRHLDLLPHCRRIWRGALPNCKLQTLEDHICGRRREDDIPGHLIPPAYHAYVETGDAADMVRVLEHNARDLYTLAELFTAVAAKG